MKTLNKEFIEKIIAVDFDGTLCENCYPDIGNPKIDVIEKLKSCQDKGHKLILWTCRSNKHLEDAVEWCKKYGLVFDAVNENPHYEIAKWNNNPRKVGADYYLDDKSITPERFLESFEEIKEV